MANGYRPRRFLKISTAVDTLAPFIALAVLFAIGMGCLALWNTVTG